MEFLYKDHRIEVAGWLDSDGWFFSVYIYYQSERTNTLVTFSLKDKFITHDEGVKAGLTAARRWVNRDKPELKN